jgi:hypothetical protein
VDQKYAPEDVPVQLLPTTPYFLAVSCHITRKNTPRLIQAFLRYAQRGGAFDLVLAWTLRDDLRA